MSMMLTGFCIVIVLLLISVILVFVTGEATEHSTEDNSYGVSSGGSGGGSSVTPRSLPRPLPPVTSRPSPGGVPRSSPSGRRPSGSSHSTGGPTARPPASSTSVSGGLTVTTPPVIPLSPVTQVPVVPTTRSTAAVPSTQSIKTVAPSTQLTRTVRPTTRSTTTMPTTTRSTTTMRTTTRSTTTMRTTTRSTTTMRTTTRSTTTMRTTTRSTTPSTTVATPRSGIMFCVVGATFRDTNLFTKNFCDYAVFPDLIARNGTFKPIYGLTNWNTFKEAFATVVSVARTARNKEPMTFLGVWMASSDDRTKFVAEVLNMRNVTTLILQTHIARAVTRHQDCVSVPVSLMTSRGEYPTYMNMFVVNMSDGWALFEVDRDTWRPCGRPFMYDYPRLTRAQQQARHREVVDTRFLPSV
ncbi:uncharacterized protein LOC142814261 isoform X2 [Rhipicephalus microplus]|uniref:uncharacterized protein LOC142814261 isoform X2 n=1 Tax=Rhipicephalus microplus TaxID=6941 RepID=UPI003F6D39EB